MSSAGTAYVDIEAKLDSLASDVDAAISAIDTQTIDIEAVADTSTAQEEIDALEGSPIDVAVGADVSGAESEIESIPDPDPKELEVTANTEQAQKGIDDLSGSVGALGDAAGVSGAGGALGGLTDDMAALAGASGAAATGIGLAAGAVAMSVSAAADAQVVSTQTSSILDSLGDSAVTSADHIDELSQRVMEYSGFSDEAVGSAANTLLMFDQINSEATFDRAIESSADLARMMGTTVPQAAGLLGRALQDPEAGMGRLKRVVGDLTDEQKAQIAAFLEVGDVASAQDIILGRLEGRIGNLAEDYGQTLTGSVDRAKESMDELAESTGQTMVPVMESLADLAGPIGEWTQKFHDATGNLAMGPLAGITGTIEGLSGAGIQLQGVGTVIGDLPPGLQDTAAAADAAANEMRDFTSATSDYLAEVVGIPASQRDVQQSITDMVATMQDSESTWFDMADAQDDVTSSTAALIGNMREHGASQVELDGVISNTIGMLRAERDAGHLTQDQFRFLADEIRGIPHTASTTTSTPGLNDAISNTDKFAQKAKEVDKLNPSTSFSAPGLSDAYSKSVNYLSTLDQLDGKVITSTFRTVGDPTGKASAVGGPLAAGELSLVGEQGPELFVPNTGGNIVPAMQTASLMMGRGATYNVNVYATSGNGDDIARAVTDAIRKLERAGR